MKCIECKKFITIENTEKTGTGVCSFPECYFPVDVNDNCIYTLKPYTCSNCDRLGEDWACFTHRAEDSAYHGDNLCSGFIDKKEIAVEDAITEWFIRGFDVKSKLNDILNRIDLEELPIEENLRK